MNTNILFKIDKKTKERAAKKAKKQGLTLSAFLRNATKAYAEDDFDIDIEITPKTRRSVEKGLAEAQNGDISSLEDVRVRLGV